MIFSAVFIFIGAVFNFASAQQYNDQTLPSPVKYYDLPQLNATARQDGKSEETRDHEARLGLQLGYGNDLQGYSGGNLLGNYTPLKIDLGGVVIGTFIGLGAVLLAPKLLHLFSSGGQGHPVGPYSRSEEVPDVFSSIKHVISRIDETLQEHDIDTVACLQKAACTLVSSATTSTKAFAESSSNPIINFLMEGSKLKAAMERGLKGDNCSVAFPQCSISSSAILKDNKL